MEEERAVGSEKMMKMKRGKEENEKLERNDPKGKT